MDREIEDWLDREASRYAEALFGGVPASELFGMPLLISAAIPENIIRVVEPVSGHVTEIHVPPAP